MKKLLLLLIVLLISCQKDNNVKHLKIGLNAEYPPYEYLEGNQYKGFNVELVSMVLDHAGYTYEFVNMNFDGLLAALQSKKIDLVIGVSPTPERKKSVDYSENYSSDYQVILVTKNNIDTFSIENLQGRNIGALLGSMQENILNTIDGVIPILYNNYTAAILDIKNQKIDGIILSSIPSKEYIKQNPELVELGSIENPIGGGYAFALNKGQEELLENINKSLKELQEDGIVDQVKQKYNL